MFAYSQQGIQWQQIVIRLKYTVFIVLAFTNEVSQASVFRGAVQGKVYIYTPAMKENVYYLS